MEKSFQQPFTGRIYLCILKKTSFIKKKELNGEKKELAERHKMSIEQKTPTKLHEYCSLVGVVDKIS